MSIHKGFLWYQIASGSFPDVIQRTRFRMYSMEYQEIYIYMLRTVIYNAQLSRRYHYFCFFLDFCFFWPKKKSIRGFLNPVNFIKNTPWVYLSKRSQIARKHLLISLSARNFAIYTLIFRNVRILFCNYIMV